MSVVVEAIPSISASQPYPDAPFSPASPEAVAWGDPLFGGEVSDVQQELREVRRRWDFMVGQEDHNGVI